MAMIVIVPNLPPKYGIGALRALTDEALENVWLLPLFKKGQITNYEILRIHDPDGAGEECHGLVHLHDRQTGKALIRQLGKSTLNGRPIQARQFFERNSSRDHRVDLHADSPLAIVDRRKGDRRRSRLMIELVTRP